MHSEHVQPPKLVGILGGMGPAATVDLLNKIIGYTPADRDQDHVPLVVWNVPQVPARTDAILSDLAPSPLVALEAGARSLSSAGAAAIAIACNTAHHWATQIEAAAGVPLLHIADAAIDDLRACDAFNGRVVLLATSGTHRSGLYAQRAYQRNVSLENCSANTQFEVDRSITLAKQGNLDAAADVFRSAIESLVTEGATAGILACTELPLLLPRVNTSMKLFDATASLARAIVGFSLGQRERASLLGSETAPT